MASKLLKSLVTFLLLMTLGACASFRGGQLPERSLEDLSAPAVKASLDLGLVWVTNGKENSTVRELVAPNIIGALEESNFFSSITEEGEGATYVMDLRIENTGNTGVAAFTGFLSGLTLFAFPGYAKDKYRMEASLSRGGQVLSTKIYSEHLTSWFQWVMVFFAAMKSPNRVTEELIEDLILNFLYDLQSEGVFPRA